MQNVWDQTSHKQLAAAAKMLFPNNLLGQFRDQNPLAPRTCQHNVYALVSRTQRA